MVWGESRCFLNGVFFSSLGTQKMMLQPPSPAAVWKSHKSLTLPCCMGLSGAWIYCREEVSQLSQAICPWLHPAVQGSLEVASRGVSSSRLELPPSQGLPAMGVVLVLTLWSGVKLQHLALAKDLE